MAQEKTNYPKSIYFKLPNYRIIGVGNTYTGSETTFHYRLKLDKEADRIHLWVWYGMKCFGLSEIVNEHDAENSEKGMSDLAAAVDTEYDIYKEKLRSGEVKRRPTYDSGEDNEPVLSDYEIFGENVDLDAGGSKN